MVQVGNFRFWVNNLLDSPIYGRIHYFMYFQTCYTSCSGLLMSLNALLIAVSSGMLRGLLNSHICTAEAGKKKGDILDKDMTKNVFIAMWSSQLVRVN